MKTKDQQLPTNRSVIKSAQHIYHKMKVSKVYLVDPKKDERRNRDRGNNEE